MLSSDDVQSLKACAHAMAESARRETLRYFRKNVAADNKDHQGFDPVTVADRASEAAMREILAELRPEDAIFGEEYGVKDGTSGLTWVLDPIDGTRGYISGTPTWGVLISVNDENGPIYGLIDQPFTGERFEGGLGCARVVGPMGEFPLSVRQGRTLSEVTLLSTFPEVGTKDEEAAFRRVADRVKLTRYGMDCYGYALLAHGQVDLVIEAGLSSYDISAPIAVIEAAGGIVTNWQGEPAQEGGQVIAAATPDLHAAALTLLNPR